MSRILFYAFFTTFMISGAALNGCKSASKAISDKSALQQIDVASENEEDEEPDSEVLERAPGLIAKGNLPSICSTPLTFEECCEGAIRRCNDCNERNRQQWHQWSASCLAIGNIESEKNCSIKESLNRCCESNPESCQQCLNDLLTRKQKCLAISSDSCGRSPPLPDCCNDDSQTNCLLCQQSREELWREWFEQCQGRPPLVKAAELFP